MVVDVEMELKLEFSARPDLLRTTNSTPTPTFPKSWSSPPQRRRDSTPVGEHDLAHGAAAVHEFERLGGLLQRKFRSDERVELAGGQ